MSAPTAPYATSAQVAVLLTNLLKGGADFTTGTTPTKAMVDSVILWVSSQVDMQFGAAGYKVPFVEISGETWPTSQTQYLALITSLGSAAYVGGHILKPAPAVNAGSPGGAGNVFQDLFDKQLKRIFDEDSERTRLRFRADFYAGTPAENALTQPSGPTTDFMEGYYDLSSHQTLWDFTQTMREIQETLRDYQIPWNYMWGYGGFEVGLGL